MDVSRDDITQTRLDLLDDFAELLYMAGDVSAKLEKNLARTKLHAKSIPKSTIPSIDGQSSLLRTQLDNLGNRIRNEISLLDKQSPAGEILSKRIATKQELTDNLRSLMILIGSIATMSDFQSPGSGSSIAYTMAGRLTGSIHATTNDYKRDQHEDAYTYEEAFRREYIDGWLKNPVHVYATSSGMASLTTILNFLQGEGKMKRSILVGSSTYFQSKELIKSLHKDIYNELPESDTDAIIGFIRDEQPEVIFLDTVANTPEMSAPNLDAIIDASFRYLKKQCYLVIDNTVTATAVQPLPKFLKPNANVGLIVYESLLKYHEFGLDRTNAGILWAIGRDTQKLFYYRENSGTIISDTAAVTLPTPNRILFDKRLKRIGRNTHFLAHSVETNLTAKSPVESVFYPGLPSHPDFGKTNYLPFQGGFMTLKFKTGRQTVKDYRKMESDLMKLAKASRIPLITGSSFGFPITRIYVTATQAAATTPFFRIAPGTESFSEMKLLAEIFNHVINSF